MLLTAPGMVVITRTNSDRREKSHATAGLGISDKQIRHDSYVGVGARLRKAGVRIIDRSIIEGRSWNYIALNYTTPQRSYIPVD